MLDSKTPETVIAVAAFWDSPIIGVANFGGQPHAFECVFSKDLDEYVRYEDKFALFKLAPIDSDTLALAVESDAILRRWRNAVSQGEARNDLFPMPEDKSRHEELKKILLDRLTRDRPDAFEALGNFGYHGPNVGLDDYKVLWKKP